MRTKLKLLKSIKTGKPLKEESNYIHLLKSIDKLQNSLAK